MLSESQFAKDAKSARKYLKSAEKSLDKIDYFIEHNKKQDAITESFKYEEIAEKIVNNARLMPIATGVPEIDKQVEDIIIKENNVIVEFTEENWFHVSIPSLLPRKERGNPSYIRATLSSAMKKYFAGNMREKMEDNCIFIFQHNYSKQRSEREYRDHDNIELNSVVDMIALYVLIDDSPLRCKHYYCSAISETDNTQIYIVPEDDFIKWLSKFNN